MSNFKQKALQCSATIPESLYISPSGHGPLPFRSTDSTNYNQPSTNHIIKSPEEDHHVKWVHDLESINGEKELNLPFNPSRRVSNPSANKENVKSWLDSTSPTSVLNINQHQMHGEIDPPTPSPICSPSPSSPISSPRPSILKPKPQDLSLTEIVQFNPSNNLTNQSNFEAQASGSQRDEGSTSKRHWKDMVFEAPPDSPTGSSFSSGSEGGLLALLASKLFSYREHSRGSSRYARERSGTIDDKHVMEDRGRKPPVEEIHIVQDHRPQTEPLDSNNGLHRTASEAASELSLGSAYGRTLSMEFDAMLAAAAVTGVRQATNTPSGLEDTVYSRDRQQQQLLEIQEDQSLRNSSFAADQYNDPNLRALVRVGDVRRASTSSDDEASRMTNALTVMRQGGEMDFNSTSEIPLLSQSSSHGGRRAESEENNNMQIVPTTSLMRAQSPDAGYGVNNNNNDDDDNNTAGLSHTSSSCASNRDSLALVLVADPSIMSSSASSSIKEKNIAPITNPARKSIEKVRRDKVLAQALAYQDAKNSQYDNRYRREETKINAWENQQRIKASVSMKKVEMKLEEKRAKAFEKMQNEIALAHKKAEQKKASAEAVRAAKTAKVAEVADTMRRSDKVSSGCLPFL